MKPNQSSLFSNNSPWKDGIEPVFQTGQFAIAQQQQYAVMQNMNRYYPQMPYQYQINPPLIKQRNSFQSLPSPLNRQLNNSQQQINKGNIQKTSIYKEQFQQIFNQEQENVKSPYMNTPHSNFSNNNYNNTNSETGRSRRDPNQQFQAEAAKVVVNIQDNLLGIIQGIQKNIVKSVNSNVNHQLKKQRYIIKKKHEQILQQMNDQEIVRGVKFPQVYSPSEKQQQKSYQKAERSYSAVGDSKPFKTTNKQEDIQKPITAEIQLKEKSQSQQNKNNNTQINLNQIQKVKQYSGDELSNKRDQSYSNRNQNKPDSSRSSTNQANNTNTINNKLTGNQNNVSYENMNKTIKDEEVFIIEERKSVDYGTSNQTLKKNKSKDAIGNQNININSNSLNNTSNNNANNFSRNNNSNNNKLSVNRKYDQLFEDTSNADGLQQSSAMKNDFLDDGNSLAYTLDDEISKVSVFFGNNRDSIAFDQSKIKIGNTSRNPSIIQQHQQNQAKNIFEDDEEVDLDDLDDINQSKQGNQRNSQGFNNINTQPATRQSYQQQQKKSNQHEKSPLSDQYGDELFEDLLDEDEIDGNFSNVKKQQTYLKNESNQNNKIYAQQNYPNKQVKQPDNKNDEDDAYKYDSDEFDLDDF
ncbi:hypothetical protein ABPG72_018550 [Tetrahymena utriculariae]